MKKTIVNGFSLNEPEIKTESIKEVDNGEDLGKQLKKIIDCENTFYQVIDGAKKVKAKELFHIITTAEMGGNSIDIFFQTLNYLKKS